MPEKKPSRIMNPSLTQTKILKIQKIYKKRKRTQAFLCMKRRKCVQENFDFTMLLVLASELERNAP